MVREELRASNVKDYDGKLRHGFEVLRRANQIDSLQVFKVYKWWQRTKKNLVASAMLKSVTSSFGLRRAPTKHRFSLVTFPTMRKESMSSTISSSPSPAHDAEDVLFDILSRWYRIWECIVVVIAAVYAITLPYFISFWSRTETIVQTTSLRSWIAFACLMDVFCVADLVLKHTSFKSAMEKNNESSQPATPRGPMKHPQKYSISAHFVLDGIRAIPFDWLLFLPQLDHLSHAMWYYFALFQFNKIFRIYEAKEASERLAQLLAYDLNLPIHDRTLRLIRSICSYLLAGHWIACVWYRVSLYAYEHSPTSWLSAARMLAMDEFTTFADVSEIRRYLRSAHFAAGSITTVFFGDIASSNVIETVTEIGVILLSIFMFGMVVGAHSEHLEAKYKHRMQFEQNVMELYYYLKTNNIPRAMRHRLKTYYMNTWVRFHGHDDFEGVQGLSTLLVEDIAQYTLRNFASKVSILKTCDECFLRALLTCLKNVICSPNEPVVWKGDVDRSMYFIARGKIIVEGKGFQLVKEEGDFFLANCRFYTAFRARPLARRSAPRCYTCSSGRRTNRCCRIIPSTAT